MKVCMDFSTNCQCYDSLLLGDESCHIYMYMHIYAYIQCHTLESPYLNTLCIFHLNQAVSKSRIWPMVLRKRSGNTFLESQTVRGYFFSSKTGRNWEKSIWTQVEHMTYFQLESALYSYL